MKDLAKKKFKTAVTFQEQLYDLSDVVEMITSDIIESKEISHMWDEGLAVINNRLTSIENRLYRLEEETMRKGLTKLEYKISEIIKEHARDAIRDPHQINESDII